MCMRQKWLRLQPEVSSTGFSAHGSRAEQIDIGTCLIGRLVQVYPGSRDACHWLVVPRGSSAKLYPGSNLPSLQIILTMNTSGLF
jgi:hypothetical protein